MTHETTRRGSCGIPSQPAARPLVKAVQPGMPESMARPVWGNHRGPSCFFSQEEVEGVI